MSKLLLIDGSNYLFRAYHALPPLTTSKGEPSGAIKGFLGMLANVAKLSKADQAAVIFDAHGKTFRHDLYPEYKANRPPMPEDLRVQIEPLQGIIRALGWPLIIVPGIEADDVMGSLSALAARSGVDAVLATGDKDMAQLVDDHVVLLNTMNSKFYDREGVIEKYGVPPESIIDYLALMGDKVDNVPGIKSCGPKTAAKWIHEIGGIGAIREAAPAMKGKIGENLRAGLPFLDLAVSLVTIKRDAVILGAETIDAIQAQPADDAALAAFCERWEISRRTVDRAQAFAALGIAPAVTSGAAAAARSASLFGAPDVPFNAGKPAAAKTADGVVPATARAAQANEKLEVPVEGPNPKDLENLDEVLFREVQNAFDLEELAARLKEAEAQSEPVGVSLIWDGAPRHADFGGFGFAFTPLEVWVAQPTVELSSSKIIEALKSWFEGTGPKLFHDAKAAIHVLAAQQIAAGGRIDDAMLMDYVLEAHLSHDLDRIAARELRRAVVTRDDVSGKGAKRVGWRETPPESAVRYLAENAAAVRSTGSVLKARLLADETLLKVYEEIERPLVGVLARMEAMGITVNAGLLAQESKELSVEVERLTAEAEAAAGKSFNLASPKQLAQILFTDLGIPVVKKTASGTPSTDEEVLTELALNYPLPKIILEHRRLTKLKSTYLDKLPTLIDRDGRIHTTFGQAVAVTGRLSSMDPNLQNIPTRTPEGRRIRTAFTARRGWKVIDADYSQVELRIMAHLSQDEGLLSAFARGEDIHRSTASEVFHTPLEEVTSDQRRMAKVINFGLIYGMSAFGLAQQMGLDRKVAAAYVDEYFHKFPGVKRYMEKTRAQAAEDAYVETAFGRRLWVPDIKASRPMVRAAAERAAINAPMQGTAADIIKRAMIAVDKWLADEKLEAKLLLQVHDELIVEAPEHEVELVRAKLPELMAAAADLSVPLIAEVGVGESWNDAH